MPVDDSAEMSRADRIIIALRLFEKGEVDAAYVREQAGIRAEEDPEDAG